ncbi:c-type cytochrome [Rhizosaccharibacter radicis]|uniref:Cytochrome c n=1 Tax=Rhizosaccharibacter radicis TaxID=2782605 RepID=A0ABT1VT23_9PROT|nr:cytochrome c [Acetobacteraceae bacterium KSS12]
MLAILLAAAASLAGCKRADMYSQGKSQSWDRNNVLRHGQAMQPPVPGTVSMDERHPPVPQPPAITEAMLRRGQERFGIYCTPCHGASGDGMGMIVRRGFPRPPSLREARLRGTGAARLFDVITNGHGTMYGYADRVSPADRWAIISYIRALQRGADVPAAMLGENDRRALEAAGNDGGGGSHGDTP